MRRIERGDLAGLFVFGGFPACLAILAIITLVSKSCG